MPTATEKDLVINREDFLRQLESVQAGLSKREILEQSDCFIFRDEEVFTYNDDISCRGPTGLDSRIEGAVKGQKLLEALREYPDKEVGVSQDDGAFILKGKAKRRTKIRMEKEINLPIDQVEEAKKWIKLPDDFCDAVQVVHTCAAIGGGKIHLTCVHIHPKWMEACDNFQICRWKIRTGIEESILIKQDSIKHVATLGMTEMSVVKGWVHFRNGSGVVFSCRKTEDTYDFDDVTTIIKKARGVTAALPKGLIEAAKRAQIFSLEDPKFNRVRVDLQQGQVIISGEGSSGEHQEGGKTSYSGQPFAFRISPVLLMKIVKEFPEVELNEKLLRAGGDKFVYVACLIKDDTGPLYQRLVDEQKKPGGGRKVKGHDEEEGESARTVARDVPRKKRKGRDEEE